MTNYYIGLMSGNSLDAMDAALVVFAGETYRIVATHSVPIPHSVRHAVQTFTVSDATDVVLTIDGQLAELAVEAVMTLLARVNMPSDAITAIGFHGQTLCHLPQGQPWTMQIGNAHLLAAKTGIDVVADFRRRDVVEGGQGAPLAPLLHQFAFASADRYRCIVNIGGIANVTVLAPGGDFVAGFDTGPGNILLDGYMQEYCQQPYDDGGDYAASGTLLPDVLAAMLRLPFFHQSPPKSTGREQFNLAWALSFFPTGASPADIMQTLTHLTAASIAGAIQDQGAEGEVLVCGGGAYNAYLLGLIRRYLGCTVASTEMLGIAPQAVEAVTFAYLAYLHVQKKRVDLKRITGAQRPYQLGVYCPA